MSKIATNSIWSSFSLKGRKGKLSFLSLPCARLVVKTCQRNHPTATLGDIELELAEYLKHAPKRVGGSKYQRPASKRGIQDCLGDEDH
ncbi:hypothetical protein V1264_007182 [Littorina saxatilis]|uniref:Uncharacterized protein n=1 Tax=Littorina saxatilis TaxID=31220 RepID=A0AAN9G3G9_9CAEN